MYNTSLFFTKTFLQIFQTVSPGQEAARFLVSLHQGKQRVMHYETQLCTLVAESGWNQPALVDYFLNGLSETLKDHLAHLNLPDQPDFKD